MMLSLAIFKLDCVYCIWTRTLTVHRMACRLRAMNIHSMLLELSSSLPSPCSLLISNESMCGSHCYTLPVLFRAFFISLFLFFSCTFFFLIYTDFYTNFLVNFCFSTLYYCHFSLLIFPIILLPFAL